MQALSFLNPFTFRFRLLNFLAIMLCWPVPAAPVLALDNDNDVAEVESLIASLDDRKYAEREAATEQLVQLGSTALKPIAQKYFDASPEIVWRIRRILKQIATEAQEELTSLQAIGVLIVLDQNHAQQLDNDLTGLLSKWRENRSSRAIEYLVSLGAKTSPSGVQRQLFLGNLRGQPLGLNAAPAGIGQKNPLRQRTEEQSALQAQSAIDQIVSGDFESVQNFVFNRLPVANTVDEQLVRPQIIINGRQVGIGGNSNQSNWTYIEIGSTWTGKDSDLERLKDIHSLRALRFLGQELSPETQRLVSRLETLQHLGMLNSTLQSKKSIALMDIPRGLTSMELGNVIVDGSVVDWMAGIPLDSLTLERCTIKEAGAEAIKDLQQLMTLDLRRIRVDRSLFLSLAEVTSLKRLNLSVCRFKGDDYRMFARIRPRIAVFNPVSFLGVQARPTGGFAENWSCEIELVVADSAADKAGVRAGDIIEAVNGEDVVSFQDLRMYISQYEIGEKMKLSVERSGKKIELVARLGDIEDR